jgi:hypothetical protein
MTAPPGQQQQQLVESKGQLVVSLPQVLQGETEDTIADVAVAVLGLSEEECAALRQYPQGLQKRTLMKLRAGAAGGEAAAAAAAAGGAAAADVEVCAELVRLSIEGSGAPFSMDCPLYKRKLQVVAIENLLAAKRLSLLGINGNVPSADEKGYTVETYEPGSTVTITAEPRAGVKMTTAYSHATPKSRLLSLWA